MAATALVLEAAGRRENGRWKRGSTADISEVRNSTYRELLSQCGVVLDFKRDLAAEVARRSRKQQQNGPPPRKVTGRSVEVVEGQSIEMTVANTG